MSLVCSNCGKKIETVPLQCGHSITINSDTNKWECDMGRCGVVSFDNFLCENCCINSSIMEIFNRYESLSENNLEFHEELEALKLNTIQTTLNDPDFKYWVKFGGGIFKCGKGKIESPSINVICSQKSMSDILKGDTSGFNEFMEGNLKVEGDMQYVVVYFDLLRLAAEIYSEEAVLFNE
jgi:putative sterol carrier protein